MLKQLISILILTFLYFNVSGQIIEYRNDSLFISDTYVDAQIKKTTLDSLLKSKATTKNNKSDFPKCSHKNKVRITTYFYKDLGIFFKKYDCDTTKFSLGIKLYHDTDPNYDRLDNRKSNNFEGNLIIGGNLINEKRNIRELKEMENCTITVTKITVGTMTRIIGGDIIYQLNLIRLNFDSKTEELTHVFIHHNFKDR